MDQRLGLRLGSGDCEDVRRPQRRLGSRAHPFNTRTNRNSDPWMPACAGIGGDTLARSGHKRAGVGTIEPRSISSPPLPGPSLPKIDPPDRFFPARLAPKSMIHRAGEAVAGIKGKNSLERVSCEARRADTETKKPIASAPAHRRNSHRNRGPLCGRASRLRRISPRAGRAGISCRPGHHGALA